MTFTKEEIEAAKRTKEASDAYGFTPEEDDPALLARAVLRESGSGGDQTALPPGIREANAAANAALRKRSAAEAVRAPIQGVGAACVGTVIRDEPPPPAAPERATDGRCDTCGEACPGHPAFDAGLAGVRFTTWRWEGDHWAHRCGGVAAQAGHPGAAVGFAPSDAAAPERVDVEVLELGARLLLPPEGLAGVTPEGEEVLEDIRALGCERDEAEEHESLAHRVRDSLDALLQTERAAREKAERERDEALRKVGELQVALDSAGDEAVDAHRRANEATARAESAERAAAELRGEVERADGAIRWALGEEGEFDPPRDAKRYWWRGTLRRLSGLVFVRGQGRSVRAALRPKEASEFPVPRAGEDEEASDA